MTTTSAATFVLGSQDAEMIEIERLTIRSGARVLYAATLKDGKPVRVAPGMNGTVVVDAITGELVDYSAEFIGVEVAMVTSNGRVEPVIDHHEPGDARTLAPPERAFEASSIGQTVAMLKSMGVEIEVTPSMIMAGESDHNLPAFCAGKCSTNAVSAVEYTIRTRHATFGGGISLDAFRNAVADATATLVEFRNEDGYADLRSLEIDGPVVAATGEQYPARAQFLPVAASIAGIGYIVDIKRKDGFRALRIGGFEGNHPVLLAFEKDPTAFGVYDANAPRPNNAYAFTARGMGGGTYINQV